MVNQYFLYLNTLIQKRKTIVRTKLAIMRKRLLLLTALLTVLLSPAFAQKKELTGKIIDATSGTPISGVSILSDRKESTTSKMDGSFSLQVTNDTRTLVISHVGYTTQTITIGSGLSFDIRLETASVQMDDVVVIGYGTQRKSHLTGAISKYKNEKLDEAPVSRLDQALQGKIAGVVVQNTSSEAGADPKIQVRGISSINAQAVPLVVVDGHVVPDGLSYVNPADVESIEVLKDAASSAIYGSRGANGVIIVTTKSGKAERTRYSFKASTGAKTAYELYPMLSMTEYGNLLFYEASLKAKDPSITAPTVNQIMAANERAGYVIENTLLGGRPTNWQDQAIRNATVHNLQMNVSGGNSALRYYISGGYQKDQGMMYHSEYDRFNLRTKLDAQLGKRVKLTLNVNPSYIRRERPSVNYIDFVRFYSFLPVYHTEATAAFVNQSPEWAHIKAGDFAQARHFNNRVYSGLMPDGSMWNTNTATSPFNTSNNTPKSIMENRTITSHDYRIQGSGDVTINLAKGLDFKTLLSAYAAYSSSLDFAKRNAQSEGSINRGIYGNRLNIDLLSEYTLNYNRQLGDHNFTLLGGFTAQTTKINTEQVTGLDYPSDNITTLNTALQIDQAKEATFNIRDEVGLLSYLGRINYSYKNKYLLSASYRADGSSYFAEGRKWGYFPAVSLGWMVTEEDFMQDVTPINNLKLRASYGATGNNRIPSFSYLDLLYAANYSFGSGTGSSTTGQAPSRSILGNADITWERTFMYNFGMDVVLFRNAINLSVDYYQSETEKLLLRQATMAFTGVPETWNNIGRLQNRGLEIELSTNNIRGKDFRWTTSANFAHNKNKVLELGDE